MVPDTSDTSLTLRSDLVSGPFLQVRGLLIKNLTLLTRDREKKSFTHARG
jgi:hypothetical protein